MRLDARGNLLTTWRREQTVYLAEPGSAEVVVGQGVNPAMAAAASGPVVAWNGAEGLMLKQASEAASVVDAQGKFASLGVTPHGVVLAFERGTHSVVRRLESRN